VDAVGFDDFVGTLQPLGGLTTIDPASRAEIQRAANTLEKLPRVTVGVLTRLVESEPDWVPYLGLVAGLSQEQLKNTLRHRLGSTSWTKLVKTRPAELIQVLDEAFGLVELVKAQRKRRWSFADVLLERYSSRTRAGGAIGRGRRLEDQVEAIVKELGLPHAMRGRFVGRRDAEAPADLAIPEAGRGALIVCAAKGFDSTGSKLSDAVNEIQQMAEVRLPRQFVFVVLDGIGWLSRQADLRRIHRLWENRSIDGVYTVSMLGDFRTDLEAAAGRLKLELGES